MSGVGEALAAESAADDSGAEQRHADSLATFVEDCRFLQADLGRLIKDLELADKNKTDVRYALDFAEIYAYAYPNQNAEALKIFREDHPDTARVIQHFVLRYLLFALPSGPPVLLPPYLEELLGFLEGDSQQRMADIARDAAEATAQIRALIGTPGFIEIQRIADEIRRDPKSATQLQVRSVQHYLERRAGRLVALLERSKSDNHDRLLALFQRERFADLKAFGFSQMPIDWAMVAEWSERLDTMRPGSRSATNFRDACAMVMVLHANRELAAQNARVFLVTRSHYMHQLLDELTPSLPKSDVYLLRHPKTFVALQTVLTKPVGERLQYLTGLQQSLTVFLHAYAHLDDTPKQPDQRVVPGDALAPLQKAIDDVRHQWSVSAGLASLLQGPDPVQGRSGSNDRTTLVQLLDIVTQPSKLNDLVEKRIDELRLSIESDWKALPVAVRAGLSRDDYGVSSQWMFETFEGKVVVRSDLYWMPYTLSFRTPDLRKWADVIKGNKPIGIDDFLALLRKGFELGANYEVLLCIAYVFGAWHMWSIAETYCRLSLRQRSESEPAAFEAHFFIALCLRMQGGVRRMEPAWRAIRKASELKARARGPHYRDPRYLKEEAVIILEWAAIDPKRGGPPVEDAFALSDEALRMITDDPYLSAQIHNNLCYWFLRQKEPIDRVSVRQHYDKLVATLRDDSTNERKWDPNFVDTVVWARWKLADDDQRAEVGRQAIADLTNTLERLHPQDPGKREVEAHRAEIEDSLGIRPANPPSGV